jgi:hypothetical protein
MFRALISTSLFWAWFAGYATVSAMAFLPEDDLPHLRVEDVILWLLTRITFLVAPILVFWSFGIAIAAVVAVYIMYRKHRFKQRMFKFYLRFPQYFQSQIGEKEARREKYMRNLQSKRRERKRRRPQHNEYESEDPPNTQVYTPQIGLATGGIAEVFSRLADTDNLPIDEDLIDKIENLGALYTILREAVSTTQMCGALFLYFKTHYRKSVAVLAANYLAEVCELDFSTQSGEFCLPRTENILNTCYDTQTGELRSYLHEVERPKWLKLLKDCQENWTLVIRNEGFSKISKILSLAVGLGLCEASSLDFRVGSMKLFSIGAAAKQASCVDLIDAVFETIVFFAEGGYACFERGSIKPLLYGNMENEEFEENFGICQQCFDYAKAGNLELQHMDENDYEELLCRTIEKCQDFITTSRGAVEKNVYRRKLDALRSWQSSFRQTRVQGGLRVSPYSIGVFGGTAVGKSSVANILMVTTLLHNNYKATDDRIITLNEADKFMSNYRSYMNGVLIDDIGNTKPEFVQQAPTTLMVQLVNNVRMYANMAEAELKGKVSVEPKCVVGTKNVKDSCATVYSNEPTSITRRDRITITVKVREEFKTDGMLDSDKVTKHFNGQVPLIPDLWYISVERSFPIPSHVEGAPALVGWKYIKWDGVPLKDVSLHHFVRYVAQDSKGFFEAQEKLVANNTNLAKKLVKCKDCGLVTDVCVCEKKKPVMCLDRVSDDCPHQGYCTFCEAEHNEKDPEEESFKESLQEEDPYPMEDLVIMDNQFGVKIAKTLSQRFYNYTKGFVPKMEYWTDVIEERTVEWMVKRLDWLENSPFTTWTNWIPTDWLSRGYIMNLIWLTNETKLKERIRRSYFNHIILAIVLFIFSFCTLSIFYLTLFYPFLAMGRIVEVEKKRLYEEVSADNRAMPAVFKMYRDRHVKWITGCCLAVAALYGVALVWKQLKVVPSPQGNLAPTADVDIEERDTEVNPWSGVVVSEMPCSDKAKTTSVDDLENMVFKNLAFMEMRTSKSDKVYVCDAFFPCSNIALVPHHMWIEDDMKISVTRHDPTLIGGNFETWIHKGHSVRVPNTDLSLVWVPNGGDWKDLTAYLPESRFASVPARFVYKKEDGSKLQVSSKTPKTKMNPGPVFTKACTFFGSRYKLPMNTFEGLCMGALVTETKGPLIGGFHLGGVNGHVDGCSGLLTQDQMANAKQALSEKPGVVLAKSEGTVPKQLYDIQFYQGPDVHPKSAINYLPKGAYCKYYGQCTGRATYHSEVEDTIISKHVEDVTGVPQKWGPPKFRKGWPFQASLQYSTKPSQGIEGSLLTRAAKDYIVPVLKALDQLPKMKSQVRPLTEMETVCGIDGMRFVDKMPPSTSIGFPLSGPKSNFLTLLDPEEYPDHQCPAELDPMFWKHAYEMEELYLAGERAYPIFKACLKDEATKLTKDKVRVFQGAPTALQLLVRKYYLPIARIISMMPLTSECAVGINAQGPEWDQLAKHVRKYGENRILAGDYSKYDLRMPAQVMFSAFRIMMDIGKHCGYSERDLQVMEGIATDICYPLMAYNGDLIQHYGSNPSGQNLTVYINSIVNALLFRCAYYHICRDRKDLPEFRDVCALITYGDDAKSSVHQDFPEFNHISVAEFLEERDMLFTMPDKESDPVPYMKDKDADLLKRKNIFSPDTGFIMGALDEDSIFKALHAVLRSKSITRAQQAMQIIDGALREWFAYGREHYEMRRAQMIEIAERAEIAHGCLMLTVTYDDMLESYKEKYDVQGLEKIVPRPFTTPTVPYVPTQPYRKYRPRGLRYRTKRQREAAEALILLSKTKVE